MELIRKLWRSEDGQDLAEYGLLLALIALVVVGAVTLLGGSIGNAFSAMAGQITW